MASIRTHVTRDMVTLDAAAPIREAARLMADRKIGSVAVREGGSIVGLVTERDLVIRVLATGGAASPADPRGDAARASRGCPERHGGRGGRADARSHHAPPARRGGRPGGGRRVDARHHPAHAGREAVPHRAAADVHPGALSRRLPLRSRPRCGGAPPDRQDRAAPPDAADGAGFRTGPGHLGNVGRVDAGPLRATRHLRGAAARPGRSPARSRRGEVFRSSLPHRVARPCVRP